MKLKVALLLILGMILEVSVAHAQYGGRGGGGGGYDRGGRGGGYDRGGYNTQAQICFFDQPNYMGNTFCMKQGEKTDNLIPSGWNDRIRSMKVYGTLTAVIYDDVGYRGSNFTITHDNATMTSFWGVSSIIVAAAPVNPITNAPSTQTPYRPAPPVQAPSRPAPPAPPVRRSYEARICFFDQPNYVGNTFCMKPGDSLASLIPSGWNDRIKSMTVDGILTAVIYDDVGYRGSNFTITHDNPTMTSFWGVSSIVVVPNPTNPMAR